MTATEPYWVQTSDLPRYSRLSKTLDVDVAVIGGGITGVTAAYLLKKSGATVALLERVKIGGGDTCATTAHLSFVTDTRLSELVSSFGKDHAQAAWDAGAAARLQIEEIVRTERIACGFQRVPAYLHVPYGVQPTTTDALNEDARLASELGFEAEFLASTPFMHTPGICFPNQAKFHPLQYVGALAARIPGDGCNVFEDSNIDEVIGEPLTVKANGHSVRCKRLVIATHVPLTGVSGLLGAALFQTKLSPYTSYVIGAEIAKASVPNALFWDTADPYHYLRIEQGDDRDYVIFGGQDCKTGQEGTAGEQFQALEAELGKMLPDAIVQRRWSGQVVETHDGLPFIGGTAEMQFIATGYAGNGMTFGTIAAIMARDAIVGTKNPWAELFSPGRKKLSSAWSYLKENVDYPYYMIRDRLAGAAGGSLENVKRGEGKLLECGGTRVAAYRDSSGCLTTLSPVCTHLGCIVRWNEEESTWDCPCHGSRFKATGEVLAGPAEKGLEPVDVAH